MKKYEWLEEYATGMPGVRKDYQAEWGAFRYLVGDKMFIMHGGDKSGAEIITVKLDPEFGRALREQYPGVIVPGYYMNKVHWNSVYTTGDVPDVVLRAMVDQSYALVLNALPKKVRDSIRH